MNISIPINLDVCVYHEPCSDGFTAAWAVYKRYGEAVEFLPGCHEKNKGSFDYWAEKLAGKHVMVCDFSFGREMTEKLAALSASYVVLDHHKTTMDALGDLSYCYFDMNRSGALITWETLHPGKPVPLIVQYVSDRDLWQNRMKYTQEVNTVIHRKEHTFENWNKLAKEIDSDDWDYGLRNTIIAGESMLQYQDSLVKNIIEKAVVWKLAGVEFMTANAPMPVASDVCDAMRNKFNGPSAAFEVQGNIVKFSLRALPGGNVSLVAKQFPGGGGHEVASGFSLPIEKVDWVNRRVDP